MTTEDGMLLVLQQIPAWGLIGGLVGIGIYWALHRGKRPKKAPLPLGVGTGHRPPQGGSGTAPSKKESLADFCAAKDRTIRERDERITQLESDLEKLKALRVAYFNTERELIDKVVSLKAVIDAIRRDAGEGEMNEIMLRRNWGVVLPAYGKNKGKWIVLTYGCTPAESAVSRASAADTPFEALRKADEWWEKNVDSKTSEKEQA